MNIRDAIQQIVGNSKPTVQIGKVKSIDGLKCDLSVEFEEDLLDVNISLSQDFAVIPKIGSTVAVVMMGQFAYIIMVEQVEKVVLNIGGQKLTVEASGMQIEGFLGLANQSQSASLKSSIEDLIDFIQNLQTTVTTPAGPGTGVLNPALIPPLTAIKAKFSTFLS
jgi:hypothetical protein